MAIDVTPGSSTAVAYDTAANADLYFTERNISTWTGTEADKEAALVRGTDYLDRKYARKWIGIRTYEEQSLAWPRGYAVDLDGYAYGADEIPTKLKQANYEAALLILTGTELQPFLDRGNSVVRERVKAGPVESETEYSSGAPTRAEITAIDGLLAGLVGFAGGTVELLRI